MEITAESIINHISFVPGLAVRFVQAENILNVKNEILPIGLMGPIVEDGYTAYVQAMVTINDKMYVEVIMNILGAGFRMYAPTQALQPV